jgi:hypothetical protein
VIVNASRDFETVRDSIASGVFDVCVERLRRQEPISSDEEDEDCYEEEEHLYDETF